MNKFLVTTSIKSFTCSNWKHSICSLLRNSKPVEFWERHSFLTLMQLLNSYWLHGVQKCSRGGWQCSSMFLKSCLVCNFVTVSLSLVLSWRQSSQYLHDMHFCDICCLLCWVLPIVHDSIWEKNDGLPYVSIIVLIRTSHWSLPFLHVCTKLQTVTI
jgi:hypothetical protein